MNTFKKTTLYTALAGIGALGMAGTASAVHVNPDGLGQVLIYPYYTVQANAAGNTFNSLLSVVNSTASAKAVKVRFLEGKNSIEVLDFNLYLSAHDVWTAAIIPVGIGAGVFSTDKSCTTPAFAGAHDTGATAVPFTNTAYTGDGGGDGLDRTREGYVEIIEMGNVTGALATSVTHVSGVPPCTGLGNDTTNASNTVLGNGGLFGGISLINVMSGEDASAAAVALDAFRTTGVPLYNAPGGVKPQLTDALPPQTEIFNGATATTYLFAKAIDAVSAALMHNTLMNEYVLDAGTKSGTDWVITMPTKRFYVNGITSGTPPVAVANPPFSNPFTGTSCDQVAITTYNREEGSTTVTVGFSPPSPIPGTSLCYEANVVTFNGSKVLGSVNIKDLTATTLPAGAQNGWAAFDFTSSVGGTLVPEHALVSTTGATFHGLPVIGFAVQTFVNGTLTSGGINVQSTYAGTFLHKTTTLIN